MSVKVNIFTNFLRKNSSIAILLALWEKLNAVKNTIFHVNTTFWNIFYLLLEVSVLKMSITLGYGPFDISRAAWQLKSQFNFI